MLPAQAQSRRPGQTAALGGTWHLWPRQGEKDPRSLCRSWPNPDMPDGPSTAWKEAHFSAGLGSDGLSQPGGTMLWPGRP